MKKLRLICTYECNRSCKGCCNKQSSFTQDNIPTLAREKFLHEIDNYKQVIITGGEPCLFLPELHTLISVILIAGCKEIIVYTAKTDWSIEDFLFLVARVDGITLTLHDQRSADEFCDIMKKLKETKKFNPLIGISPRLNIFEGITLDPDVTEFIENIWQIKSNMKWIKNCPLPKSETLMKLEDLWIK